jgi:sulfur carrier protein
VTGLKAAGRPRVITVVANGRPVELPEGATVAALLDALDVPAKAVAAMEHNGEAVARSDHAARPLSDGDRVELVRAVAGG